MQELINNQASVGLTLHQVLPVGCCLPWQTRTDNRSGCIQNVSLWLLLIFFPKWRRFILDKKKPAELVRTLTSIILLVYSTVDFLVAFEDICQLPARKIHLLRTAAVAAAEAAVLRTPIINGWGGKFRGKCREFEMYAASPSKSLPTHWQGTFGHTYDWRLFQERVFSFILLLRVIISN